MLPNHLTCRQITDYLDPSSAGNAACDPAPCPRPLPTLFQTLLDDLYDRHRTNAEGHVATYIPELSKVCPDTFGLSVVTATGQLFEAGDCDRPFTIQSISKPFTYGLAMDEFGADRVREYVGVEPSGDAFNSIELHGHTNRPFNPMISASAPIRPASIATATVSAAPRSASTWHHGSDCTSSTA